MPMDRDTDIGGPGARFPGTQCSLLEASKSADPGVRERAFETLATAYWKPVYKYLRLRWRLSNEDAKDVTQEFFTRALAKGYLERYDAARARFRTYLRVCVDGLVANRLQAERRMKRGGGADLAVDFEAAEAELARQSLREADDVEECFQREWVRHLFGLAVAELRRSCAAQGKLRHFEVFRRYDIEGPDGGGRVRYADLARELGVPVTQVTNDLHYARRELRRIVLEQLRAATVSEREFRAEARRVLGAAPAGTGRSG
jgi:RNA polymerase sigma factor (sigma-70 family)